MTEAKVVGRYFRADTMKRSMGTNVVKYVVSCFVFGAGVVRI